MEFSFCSISDGNILTALIDRQNKIVVAAMTKWRNVPYFGDIAEECESSFHGAGKNLDFQDAL